MWMCVFDTCICWKRTKERSVVYPPICYPPKVCAAFAHPLGTWFHLFIVLNDKKNHQINNIVERKCKINWDASLNLFYESWRLQNLCILFDSIAMSLNQRDHTQNKINHTLCIRSFNVYRNKINWYICFCLLLFDNINS